MGAPKHATHQVVRSGCYFTPGVGEIKVGSQMILNPAQAEKLEANGIVKKLNDVKILDVSDADSKALAIARAELKATGEKLKTAEIELKAKSEALKKAESEIEDLLSK